jgi:hypothetical protein
MAPRRIAILRERVGILGREARAWRPHWHYGWPFDVATGKPRPGAVGQRLMDQARRLRLASNVWGHGMAVDGSGVSSSTKAPAAPIRFVESLRHCLLSEPNRSRD